VTNANALAYFRQGIDEGVEENYRIFPGKTISAFSTNK
jgi:hypothetical protein